MNREGVSWPGRLRARPGLIRVGIRVQREKPNGKEREEERAGAYLYKPVT